VRTGIIRFGLPDTFTALAWRHVASMILALGIRFIVLLRLTDSSSDSASHSHSARFTLLRSLLSRTQEEGTAPLLSHTLSLDTLSPTGLRWRSTLSLRDSGNRVWVVKTWLPVNVWAEFSSNL
jgi:hypothetical protein